MGFAVNIHYCGNSIAEISIAYNPRKCDMGDGVYNQTSNKTSFSKKSCCASKKVEKTCKADCTKSCCAKEDAKKCGAECTKPCCDK